jgi:hypothetical protein
MEELEKEVARKSISKRERTQARKSATHKLKVKLWHIRTVEEL